MVKRIAGIRFNPSDYVELDMDSMKVTEITNEGTTIYELNGGGGGTSIERKLLYDNNDYSPQSATTILFNNSEMSGYETLEFIVSNTDMIYDSIQTIDIGSFNRMGGYTAQFSDESTEDIHFKRLIYKIPAGDIIINNAVSDGGKVDNNECIIVAVHAIKINHN